jgi:hypothetical protein
MHLCHLHSIPASKHLNDQWILDHPILPTPSSQKLAYVITNNHACSCYSLVAINSTI